MFLASYYILDSLLASITKSITSKFQRLFSQSAVPHYSNKLGSFRYSYLIPNPILLFHFLFPLECYLFHVFRYFFFIHYSFLISILSLHFSIHPPILCGGLLSHHPDLFHWVKSYIPCFNCGKLFNTIHN